MNCGPRLAIAISLLISLNGCQGDAPPDAGARATAADRAGPLRVYVGTYTGKDSKGIYVIEMDPQTGALTEPKLAAETKSPSFLALHPNNKVLYAVGESDSFKGQKTGSVSSFAIDPADGTLKLTSEQPSGGAGPCHVDVDPGTRSVVVANYAGGSVAVLPLDPQGALGPPAQVVQHEGSSVNKQRQEGPHAHCASVFGPFVAVADLGLDKTFIYRYDAAKPSLTLLTTADAPPGSGPRHAAVHRGQKAWGKWMYVNNEMTSTVSVYELIGVPPPAKELQNVSTLPEGYDKPGNSTAEIAVHPSGKFLYVSNRGHDSIAVFKIDAASGKLTPAGHQSTGGKTPRNFGISPGGKFLLAANQNSGSVVVFRIDPETGALTPTGSTAAVPSPVCVVFWRGQVVGS